MLKKWIVNNKYRNVKISLILLPLLFVFFYRITFCGDYLGHYTFALDLKLLKEMSFKEFIAHETDYQIIGYPIWHIFFLIIYTITDFLLNLISPDFIGSMGRYAVAIGIENSIIVIATFWLTIAFFQRFSYNREEDLWLYLLALSMMFVGPLYIPFINPTYDLGQLLVTAWYNPTTLAVKPFALICFWIYIDLIEKNSKKENIDNSKFVLLSAILLLSGLVKPTFFQIFVPSLFIFCLIEIVKSKGKSFGFCFKIGLAIIPSCLLAIGQLWTSFYSANNNGIMVGWLTGWHEFSNHILGSILISILFPLIILFFYRKELFTNQLILFVLICFGNGILQYALLYEKAKIGHGNFSWGAHLGTFLLFLVSCVLMKNRFHHQKRTASFWLPAIALGLHVLFGLIYFINMALNRMLWGPLL